MLQVEVPDMKAAYNYLRYTNMPVLKCRWEMLGAVLPDACLTREHMLLP